MKRRLRVYRKTVSIVNETATGMYENLVGKKKGFLLESYDKNYDRYTFFGADPKEIISSKVFPPPYCAPSTTIPVILS